MKTTIILITIFLFYSDILVGQNTWNLLNPTPTFARGIDIYFSNEDQGYIITRRQILETMNGGSLWNVKFSISGVGVFTDVEFDNSTGIIVGSNGLVLITRNSGTSWEEIDIGNNQDLHTINFIDEQTIVISGANKISKSFDGGETWENLSSLGQNFNSTHFVNAETGHACSDGLILKTIDGGNNWIVTKEITTIPSNFTKIYFTSESLGYAVREGSKVYKTFDGGSTWDITNNISDDILSFEFLDNSIGYIGGKDGVLFKTIDSGETWEWSSFQIGRGYMTSVYGLHFINENIGFAVGDRGRITKTYNGGQTWNDFSPTYHDIEQLDFQSNEIGYALVNDEIFKTTNSGLVWSNIGTPIQDGEIIEMDFVDKNMGYCIVKGVLGATIFSGFVFKTSNGGNTWELTNNASIIEQFLNLSAMTFYDQNIGFVCGEAIGNKGLYKTINGGDSWMKIAEQVFSKMQFVSETTGFAFIENQEQLYRTIDGGVNWDVVLSENDDISDFHFVDNMMGYCIGDKALMLKTTNGGIEWTELSIPFEDYDLVGFKSNNEGYIVDEEGKLYETADGGSNWEFKINAPSLLDISFTNEAVYVGGTYGKILSLNSPTTSAVSEIDTYIDEIIISPNPYQENLKIELLGANKITSIKIYDIQGNSVDFDISNNIGSTVDIKLRNLVSGVYFINLTVNNKYLLTKRIVVHLD